MGEKREEGERFHARGPWKGKKKGEKPRNEEGRKGEEVERHVHSTSVLLGKQFKYCGSAEKEEKGKPREEKGRKRGKGKILSKEKDERSNLFSKFKHGERR